jgi:hypothetical protein
MAVLSVAYSLSKKRVRFNQFTRQGKRATLAEGCIRFSEAVLIRYRGGS